MALLHPTEVSNTGLMVEYWRITHRQDDYIADVINVQIHGYASQELRAAGKAPLTALQFRLAREDIPEAADLHSISTAQLYRAINLRSAAAAVALAALPDGHTPPPSLAPATLAGAADC